MHIQLKLSFAWLVWAHQHCVTVHGVLSSASSACLPTCCNFIRYVTCKTRSRVRYLVWGKMAGWTRWRKGHTLAPTYLHERTSYMSWVSSPFNGDDEFDLEDTSSKHSFSRGGILTKQKRTSGARRLGVACAAHCRIRGWVGVATNL